MKPVCPTCRRPHDEWTHHLVLSDASSRLQIDTHRIAEASLKLQLNDLKESHRFIREELSRALDLLDECLDLHSDPADSDLHTRIRKFLEPQP